MGVRRQTYPDEVSAAEACARHLVGLLEEALAGRQRASLALSGGRTPRLLFQKLVLEPFRWDRVHLFWVDERAVPPIDSESNYRLAEDWLILPAHIPRQQVHRIHGELAPERAARRYEEEMCEFFGLEPGELPRFDAIQCGMGADAHTASLFSGEPLIEDREHLAAAVLVDKLRQWRITLLPGVLLNARRTVMLVTGTDKAEAVRAVFREDFDPKRYPAQILSRDGPGVTWFLDEAAARLIE
jgi:6-phosphogluconolactonase